MSGPVRLGDLCERVTVGHVGKMSDQYVDGDGVIFLRSQDVRPFRITRDSAKRVGPEFAKQLVKSELHAGDVVVVRTGYPGTAAVVPAELEGANCADLVVITPKPELNPHVLAALFNSRFGQHLVGGRLVGSAQQHFNVTAAKELEITLPPASGQAAIGRAVADLCDLIENNRRRIEILEEMASLIYREWCVYFRFPGHEEVELVDSDLGPIPEGWDVAAFADLAHFVNGFAFKPNDHWMDEGLPIVKIKELKGGVTRDTPRYHGDDIPEKYFVDDGDVLFSWSADLDAYVWPGGPALLNQHLFVVRPQKLSRIFLFHSLRGRMDDFRARSQGTTMKHIKRSALSEVLTVVPDGVTREAFEESVGPMLELQLNLTRQNRVLAEARDLLLPRLISGEFDVLDLDLGLEPVA